MGDVDLLGSALSYAERGWHVVPDHTPRPGDKRRCSCRNPWTCQDPGKHPRTKHGTKQATCERDIVEYWWSKLWPDANIAIATGARSRLVAIDVDPRGGGDFTLQELEAKLGELPPTVEGRSGGGGRAKLFGACDVPTLGLGPGLELLSDGSKITVEPSLHIAGARYQWLHGHRPKDVAVAEFPPSWREYLATVLTSRRDAKGYRGVLEPVPVGEAEIELLLQKYPIDGRDQHDDVSFKVARELKWRLGVHHDDEDTINRVADAMFGRFAGVTGHRSRRWWRDKLMRGVKASTVPLGSSRVVREAWDAALLRPKPQAAMVYLPHDEPIAETVGLCAELQRRAGVGVPFMLAQAPLAQLLDCDHRQAGRILKEYLWRQDKVLFCTSQGEAFSEKRPEGEGAMYLYLPALED